MNAFWDFVDWLLPPVRIVDDLTDHQSEYSLRSRTTHRHPSTRRLDKEQGRERRKEKERGKEKERSKDKSSRSHEPERERFRQRIQHLERENEVLLEQLRGTREELSKLTAALLPSTADRTPQSYPATPVDPITLPLPPSPNPAQAPLPISAQRSAEAALTDPRRLRVLYTSLRATYGDARQVILSQAEELAALKSFLSKTDDWSGAQLLQAVADLNSEIIQLAASIAEEFAPALRTEPHASSVARERDREIARPALGREMMKLLESREHASDPTLVQFALQAWQVWCAARVMEAFCYGLPAEVDEALKAIFQRMQREEPQPTTSRWRALTYKHARSFLSEPRNTSEPNTPEDVSSPFHSAPASIIASHALPPPLVSLTEANLRGVLAILALSGCTDSRGLHRDPLRARFGSALARISARAERISTVMKEGVLSGLFEIVWLHPCQSPKRPPQAASSPPPPPPPATVPVAHGTPTGKGKEREWARAVQRATSSDADGSELAPIGAEDERLFEWEVMENVYAGHCNERCRVLCTVELGLAFSRRVPEEERDAADGAPPDGVVGERDAAAAGRPVGMGGVGMNGVRRNLSVSSAGGEAGGQDGSTMVRNLLLKPKVLLESVVDIL
ncbi:uncharacterized protein BXZ73DRAFT_37919 [Epithele typhae]|uniref:uncharacterized protein n=1 Tax=Epithele typhae TaxID=378194 RepID=UPI002007D15B|nr:uncharacterized protein BXZ73DRAFT_37919 [Epithele typhae]KAH9944987.1 hypothetical protein BXZ73DRAFT_37919 [Epithele typhae]